MPIITKPSEALKLALKVIQMREAPWASYPSSRGSHAYTCNALDYLVEAEEVTEEARRTALIALYPKSDQGKTGTPIGLAQGAWWYIPVEGRCDFAEQRIAAIIKTIEELEAKGE